MTSNNPRSSTGCYQQTLRTLGINCSMSGTGNCYDNAVAERFFWSLKYEWTNHRVYADLESARQSVFNYIDIFYNQRRQHQSLAWVSPSEFETDFYNRITKAAETIENSTTVTAL